MVGYNPQVTDICTALNATSAVLNGITGSIRARNNGANPYEAASVGLFATSLGLGNAAIGNCVDKATGTYLGTSTSNIFSTAASLGAFDGGYNPFFGVGMTPFMPTLGFYGMPTFGFYSMPRFGGFCCYC